MQHIFLEASVMKNMFLMLYIILNCFLSATEIIKWKRITLLALWKHLPYLFINFYMFFYSLCIHNFSFLLLTRSITIEMSFSAFLFHINSSSSGLLLPSIQLPPLAPPPPQLLLQTLLHPRLVVLLSLLQVCLLCFMFSLQLLNVSCRGGKTAKILWKGSILIKILLMI